MREKIQIVCLRGIGSGKSFLCEGETTKESKEKGWKKEGNKEMIRKRWIKSKGETSTKMREGAIEL